MHLHHVLGEIVLILGVSLAVAYVLRWLRIPSIVGFMIAGVVIGPGGIGIIAEREQIELLAEIGVVLLLFAVGLKISLRELWALRTFVFIAGAVQVVVTGVLAALAAHFVAFGWAAAAAIGAIVALSSTAVILRLLEEAGEADAAHGRFLIGVLLFQDLAVVPILFGLPLLGGGDGEWGALARASGAAAAVLVVVVIGARFVFPWLAERAVRTRSQELFTLLTTVAVFGTALLVAEFGLSMALGAFIAGMVVSDSPYSQQIVSEMSPLRDAFNSLFFVSIGMLATPRIWFAEPLPFLALCLGIIVLKAFVVAPVALALLRNPWRALIAAVGLAHVGEFSFVVAQEAAELGLLTPDTHGQLIGAAVPTLIVAPLLIAAAGALERRRARRRPDAAEPAGEPVADSHVVLVGYGVGGRRVAEILDRLQVRFVLVELNAETVYRLRGEGLKVVYGDASREAVLRKAGVERAQALVVTVPDPAGARQIVARARALAPRLTIVVRTRYMLEVEELHRLGADEVVVEEWESALELASRVLGAVGAPTGAPSGDRSGAMTPPQGDLSHAALRTLVSGTGYAHLSIPPDGAGHGQSLRDLDLRRRTGATIVGVLRGRTLVRHPAPDFELMADDELIVSGEPRDVEEVRTIVGSAP
jgi:CPA2 family monovalent cation:H+ antiporter-2